MRRNCSACLCYFKFLTFKREWHIPRSSSDAKLAPLMSRLLVSRWQPISVLPYKEETAQSNSDFQNNWVTMTFGRKYCCFFSFVFFSLWNLQLKRNTSVVLYMRQKYLQSQKRNSLSRSQVCSNPIRREWKPIIVRIPSFILSLSTVLPSLCQRHKKLLAVWTCRVALCVKTQGTWGEIGENKRIVLFQNK